MAVQRTLTIIKPDAVERGLVVRRLLPAAHRDIDERRRDLDRAATAAGAFGGDQLRARTAERLEHHGARLRVLLDRADEQLDGLRSWVALIDGPRLAVPVALPHRVVVVHAVHLPELTSLLKG